MDKNLQTTQFSDEHQNTLSNIELEISKLSNFKTKGWLLLAEKLYQVESQQLYKQSSQYSSFSNWLNSCAKNLELQPSTLWKYLRIISLLHKLNLSPSEINAPITGLDKIVSIHAIENNYAKSVQRINQLQEKKIKIAELTAYCKNISASPEVEKIENFKKKTSFLENLVSSLEWLIFSPTVTKSTITIAAIVSISPMN